MAIRNGAQQDTDYQVQHPVPLQGGTYLASTTMTVTSLVLVVAGAAVMAYTLTVEAGRNLDFAAILLVLAGAAVEGYNLMQATSRVTGGVPGIKASQVSLYVNLTDRIRIQANTQQNWPVSPNLDSRVVFYRVGESDEAAAGRLTTAEESEVSLVVKAGLVPGSEAWSVDVKP